MLRRLLFVVLALACGPVEAAAPVATGAQHGMAVSAHHLASAVGADVLREGGNVVDAAVAMGYALAVVFPAAGNLGGGGFMTLRFADGRTAFLDFREKAPLAATETMFLDASGNPRPGLSTRGWLAVGVPGSVAGLETARERWGTLPRERLIAPALALARDGFLLTADDATLFSAGTDLFRRDAAASAIFLDGGQPLRAGTRLTQPDLATTLEAIGREGANAFYRGAFAEALVAASTRGGGILVAEDLARYQARERAPLHCRHHGFDIFTAPPPSAGGLAICETLGILAGDDLAALGPRSAAEIHLLVEAFRRAYHDRQLLGDPDVVPVDLARILEPDRLARLRRSIDPVRATPSAELPADPASEGAETTHYSVMDAAGNAVAVTTTLNGYFGTGIVVPGTGVLMNNEMDDFAVKPGAPNFYGVSGSRANAVAPGKTPLSSMSPTVIVRAGETVAATGSPGGSRIPTVTLQTMLNLLDFRMSPGEAVSAPRVHHQWLPDVVEAEPYALSPDTQRLLEGAGYTVEVRPPWGQAETIVRRSAAHAPAQGDLSFLTRPAEPYILFGAADPRAPTGAAVGY